MNIDVKNIMENDIDDIINQAEMIVNGYAFTSCDFGVRVTSLNNISKVVIFDNSDKVIATTMDDIEASIVKDYYLNNKEFLGVDLSA